MIPVQTLVGPSMSSNLRFALLLPFAVLLGCFAALIGCTLPTPSSPSSPSGAWENWQIQAGTAITSPPADLYFVGALQTQGFQATGIFTSAGQSGTTTQVFNFTGTFNSTTEVLLVLTSGWGIGFTEQSTPYTLTPVSVTGGCVDPLPSGANCTAIFLVPSVGVEIAPLNGAYTGTLTDSSAPGMSGPGSLTLTQSATPNSSGAFPLTGTITFPSNSNLGTYTLTGTVSGEGVTLNFCSAAVIGPCVALTGYTNPAGTQITVTSLAYSGGGTNTSAAFTGTLTL